jgi:hypothetical protein
VSGNYVKLWLAVHGSMDRLVNRARSVILLVISHIFLLAAHIRMSVFMFRLQLEEAVSIFVGSFFGVVSLLVVILMQE